MAADDATPDAERPIRHGIGSMFGAVGGRNPERERPVGLAPDRDEWIDADEYAGGEVVVAVVEQDGATRVRPAVATRPVPLTWLMIIFEPDRHRRSTDRRTRPRGRR